MQARLNAFGWFFMVMLFSGVLALLRGWFYLVYGLVVGAAVFAFVFLVSTARLAGASDDDARPRRGR